MERNWQQMVTGISEEDWLAMEKCWASMMPPEPPVSDPLQDEPSTEDVDVPLTVIQVWPPIALVILLVLTCIICAPRIVCM